jgi:parallel beta-helix repeat protein
MFRALLAASALTLALGVAACERGDPNLVVFKAGENVQTALQEALISIKPGQTLQLPEGRFEFTDGLSLDVANVKIIGAGHDKTVLSFRNQEGAGEGLLVTSDGVTLEGFGVEDTRGDGIKSKGADNITYRNVRVEWTRGPHTDNGAYGLYPVESENVLIDGAIVKGCSDAGVYVGQSNNIIVRNSLLEQNVAGIEIENSTNADVHDNVTRNNTAGLLVFDLPGLPKVGGGNVRVFNNKSIDNDTPNFGKPGAIVSSVPKGVGLIVMANSNVEVFDNEFSGNGTGHVLVVSYRYKDIKDARYNPLPRNVTLRNNAFGPGGTDPDGDLKALGSALGGRLPDVLWDGATSWTIYADGKEPEIRTDAVKFYMRNEGPVSFLNLNVPMAGGDFATAQPDMDVPGEGTPFPALPAIKLPQDAAPAATGLPAS